MHSEKETDPMFIWDRWRYRPTGKLRLIISEYEPVGGRKSWGDGKNTKLEDKLSEAAPDFVVCAQSKHAAALAWKERERQWAEEARRRREAEERERKEQERRDVLFGASDAWRKAEGLQAFRSACESHLRKASPDGQLTSAQQKWLQWVDAVIKDTNPLADGFLGRLEAANNPMPTP